MVSCIGLFLCWHMRAGLKSAKWWSIIGRGKHGRSKYRAGRIVKGFLDLLTVRFLTGFGQRPQHLLGGAGLLFVVIGLVWLVYLAVYWVIAQLHPAWGLTPLHDRPAVLYALGSLLFGGQLMSMGFLGELITANVGRTQDHYSIAEKVNVAAEGVDEEVKR